MDPYLHPPTVPLCFSQKTLLGQQSRWSNVGPRGWSLTHILTLDDDFSQPTRNHYPFFLNVEGFFFSPEETFLKLITTGMWIFLSRVGQNKECDYYSLPIKEPSLQLLFKRQCNPFQHQVTLQSRIPQSKTNPVLGPWDQAVNWLQSLALQSNCSIML